MSERLTPGISDPIDDEESKHKPLEHAPREAVGQSDNNSVESSPPALASGQANHKKKQTITNQHYG
jgi:hypothetical protein